MNRCLLDTNALADFIFRRRGVYEKAEAARVQGAKIGTCPAVVAEFLGGIEYNASRDANLVVANRNLARFRIWPHTEEVSRQYGRLYAELRRAGISMQFVDLTAASTALSIGNCTVVSSDSDLRRVPGLNVENWADE